MGCVEIILRLMIYSTLIHANMFLFSEDPRVTYCLNTIYYDVVCGVFLTELNIASFGGIPCFPLYKYHMPYS